MFLPMCVIQERHCPGFYLGISVSLAAHVDLSRSRVALLAFLPAFPYKLWLPSESQRLFPGEDKSYLVGGAGRQAVRRSVWRWPAWQQHIGGWSPWLECCSMGWNVQELGGATIYAHRPRLGIGAVSFCSLSSDFQPFSNLT